MNARAEESCRVAKPKEQRARVERMLVDSLGEVVITYDGAVRPRALAGYLRLGPNCLSARNTPEQMPATKHMYDLGAR